MCSTFTMFSIAPAITNITPPWMPTFPVKRALGAKTELKQTTSGAAPSERPCTWQDGGVIIPSPPKSLKAREDRVKQMDTEEWKDAVRKYHLQYKKLCKAWELILKPTRTKLPLCPCIPDGLGKWLLCLLYVTNREANCRTAKAIFDWANSKFTIIWLKDHGNVSYFLFFSFFLKSAGVTTL